MIVTFTEAEIKAISEAFEEHMRATDRLESLMHKERPDGDASMPQEPPRDPKASVDERAVVLNDFMETYRAWVEQGSAEWQRLRNEVIERHRAHLKYRDDVFAAAEQREFNEINVNPQAVYDHALEQAKMINRQLSDSSAPEMDELNHENLIIDLFTTHCYTDHDNAWYNTVVDALHLHMEALAAHSDLAEKLKAEIRVITAPPARRPRPSKRKLAEEAGHMVDMGCRAISISDRDLQFALSQRQNKSAFIINLGADLIKNLTFEDGRLSLASHPEITTLVKNSQLMPLDGTFDYQLLRSLFSAIYLSRRSNTKHVVTVYLPSLCKHLGIQMNKGSAYPLLEKINAFKDFVGTYDNGSYSVLLEFIEYDRKANTMTFASPYMARIINAVEEKSRVSLKRGGEKQLPAFNFLMHSDIANERNKVAVELAHCIVTLILQRGVDNKRNPSAIVDPDDDQVITQVHISFDTLIDYVPELGERLNKSALTGAKNAQLRRAFEKTYDLLRKKTDVYENYIDLQIPDIIPTVSTLATPLIITHKGLNPKYRVQR